MEFSDRPERATPEQRHSDAVERFGRSPLPLYGLDDSWTEVRGLGGFETGQSIDTDANVVVAEHVEVGLDHGVRDRRDIPFVRVLSTSDRAASLAWRLVCHVEDTPFEERVAASFGPDDVPAGARRREIRLPVDGRAEPFDLLERDGHFVAAADRDDHRLVVEGRGVDPADLGLVTVTDLSEYAAGSASA